MRFTELVPIRTVEEFEKLKQAAFDDNHFPLWANYFMRRGDQITGFAGIDSVAFTHLWSHTKHMSAADSFSMLNAIENILRLKGHQGMIIPAHNTSTFNGHLEKAGYDKMFDTTIFYKKL
jgi:hypothetical protein